MKALLVAALPALLCGCVSSNVRDLEAEGARESFASAQNWQEVYRAYARGMQECFTYNSIAGGAMGRVDAQLYNELKLGEIVATYPKGPFSTASGPYAIVRIKPTDAGSSIQMITTGTLGKSAATEIRQWAAGKTPGCAKE